jgi:putative transposase
MIDRLNKHLSLTRQCQLLGLSRSSLYYQPATDDTEDLALMALIDRQFLETPYYGSRKMTAWLRREGHVVNRKRVRRLMRQMGLQVIWQKPNTSQPNPEHKTYPYLLRGLTIERPNQVWATGPWATRSGILRTSRCQRDFSTWWRLWTGTAGKC